MNETTVQPADSEGCTTTVITLRPTSGGPLKEITLIGPGPSKPREAPRLAPASVTSRPALLKLPKLPCVDPLPYALRTSDSSMFLPTKKIPRPPNAFMIFANDWRKRLANQHPSESNKSISVRLGQLWKNMNKSSKEVYYQRSRQANQDHKLKYPGYVYNPKEARLRKALRDQGRVPRSSSTGPASSSASRWTKYALTMNHHRQSLVSPVLLPQQQHQLVSEDSKALLHEQVVRDNSMLQSYPDYLDIPYNVPSCDYNLDTQSWYPYLQPSTQSNGPYLERPTETKLPVDWSTPYSSEQGNFIRASPQSSPYSMQNHQEVNPLMMNGEHSSAVNPEQTSHCENNCLAADHKPIVDQLVCQNNDADVVKDPEQQVKELLASAKVIPEGSPVLNGGTILKLEDGNSTRLPGFHQAFGSTEIGRFSQPDGFFEAAVAAENERKTPEVSEFTLSFSPSSAFLCCPKTEPDLFGFQESEDTCFTFSPSQFNEPNHLYTMEDGLYSDEFVGDHLPLDQSIVKIEDLVGTDEFESQDLSGVANLGKPPVIISENDNCCVVQLESSSIDNNVKEYFSL